MDMAAMAAWLWEHQDTLQTNIKLHCKAGEVGKMFGKPLSPEAPDMDEFLKQCRYRMI